MQKITQEQIEKIGTNRVVVSVSGGKDSAALSLWLKENDIDHDRIFADTGWEHPLTYDYLRGELSKYLGPITEVRGLRLMEEEIIYNKTFPSGRFRYCTRVLKAEPIAKYFETRLDEGVECVNAVGIRGSESKSRASMTEWEQIKDFPAIHWRPLLHWSFEDVVEIHKRHGLKPNPLYLMGHERVGCAPCIYSTKSELKLFFEHSPSIVDKIRRLESQLFEIRKQRDSERGVTSKCVPAFFATGGGQTVPIDEVVRWTKTARGGKQFELFAGPKDEGCLRWGMCERAPE